MARTDRRERQTRRTPPGWFDSDIAVPGDDHGGDQGSRNRSITIRPEGRRGSPVTLFGAAVIGAFIGANGWFWATVTGLVDNAWPAIALGVLVAVTARLGGGRSESGLRSSVSLGVYLLALAGVLAALTYRNLINVYGAIEGIEVFEQGLVRSYLRQTTDLVAYGLGALAAWIVARIGSDR